MHFSPSVNQFCCCTLIIWSYHRGWHHKCWKTSSTFSFARLPNNAIWDTPSESGYTNRITYREELLESYLKKHFGFGVLFKKKRSRCTLMLDVPNSSLNFIFKAMNPHLIWFWFFFFFTVIHLYSQRAG